jgi:tetratricopeptide (TPR) repeat protein
MSQYPTADKAKLKKQRTEQAISLAMQNRWEEAVLANKAMLELFPGEVQAYNRLGKALTELGRYEEAAEAYRQALALDRNNIIAQRNLARLEQLATSPAGTTGRGEGVDPRLFIEETGKTGFTELRNPAKQEVLAKLSAGDQVYLKISNSNLLVEDVRGEYLGQIEPKLAVRLMNLMKGGNKYAAAVTSVDGSTVRVVIKETYQHPSQAGKLSFPSKVADSFRPYIKETILKYGMEEDEEDEEYGGWGEREPVGEQAEEYDDDSSLVE